MAKGYSSSSRAHVIRIILTLIILVVTGILVRQIFLPDEFGANGYYRPGALEEEANREARNMAAESCLECHPLIRKLHVAGIHKTISCEACHGAFADHVKDNLVVGLMPVARGQGIRPLCLRCHNKVVRAAPPDSIKVVDIPEHMDKRKVRTDHICNQCHHVHAPLKWVHEAREMMGLAKREEDI